MGTPYTGKKPMQPHRDLIIAWANGAEIQVELDGEWVDTPTPSWSINADYRIKPQPKAVIGLIAEIVHSRPGRS